MKSINTIIALSLVMISASVLGTQETFTEKVGRITRDTIFHSSRFIAGYAGAVLADKVCDKAFECARNFVNGKMARSDNRNRLNGVLRISSFMICFAFSRYGLRAINQLTRAAKMGPLAPQENESVNNAGRAAFTAGTLVEAFGPLLEFIGKESNGDYKYRNSYNYIDLLG